MSTQRPAFWNRQLKDIRPMGFFSQDFLRTCKTSLNNVRMNNATPSASTLGKAMIVIGGVHWAISSISKRKYKTQYQYH